jgi:hypothetical protein
MACVCVRPASPPSTGPNAAASHGGPPLRRHGSPVPAAALPHNTGLHLAAHRRHLSLSPDPFPRSRSPSKLPCPHRSPLAMASARQRLVTAGPALPRAVVASLPIHLWLPQIPSEHAPTTVLGPCSTPRVVRKAPSTRLPCRGIDQRRGSLLLGCRIGR